MDLNKHIAVINGYPKPGISFKDVTPLIANPEAFNYVVDQFVEFAKNVNANVIVGPEARGFIFGAPVACKGNFSFVPVRKPGKLPRETVSYSYELEYGSDTLCMHKDAIKEGDRIVIIDDLVAVGGTIEAASKLVESLGGKVAGVACVIALEGLPGIKNIPSKYPFKALLELSDEE